MNVFTDLESEVRGYCRTWPAVFEKALGSHIFDETGRDFLDFFAGAGALNYGHNHPHLKSALLNYLAADNIVHSLDMSTTAKRLFLERFHEVVLEPRNLDYRIQFPGPTGTNSVEAALKLARKVTGREEVISFTNAFHGMTLGSLAVTGNALKRGGAGVPLSHSSVMPYCDYLDEGSSLDYFELILGDSGSGVDEPAAVIVETTQGEGGLKSASDKWLARLASICKDHGILLIVDDIQMGIGRTGGFFSFERAGIVPDIVCLSKSLSGYGLPMAVTLFRPELDVWEPGEHNGTFRGNNPAFVTATAALDLWDQGDIPAEVDTRAAMVEKELMSMVADIDGIDHRGRGLAQGVVFEDPEVTSTVVKECFERGLILETSGPSSEVAKLMPPLTISEEDLDRGLATFRSAVEVATGGPR
ncbi:MAG: diaminobutyrate--2-oxoglutarate transaminase [Microthrixaceae bacterium]